MQTIQQALEDHVDDLDVARYQAILYTMDARIQAISRQKARERDLKLQQELIERMDVNSKIFDMQVISNHMQNIYTDRNEYKWLD